MSLFYSIQVQFNVSQDAQMPMAHILQDRFISASEELVTTIHFNLIK